MKHTGFVLLITDRPNQVGPLARAVRRALDCRIIGPAETLPVERPAVAVLDLAPEQEQAAIRLSDRFRGGVPCMHILRTGSRPVYPPDSRARDKQIPEATPTETALVCILDLIDLSARRRAARTRRLEARSSAATGIVADLFGSAGSGRTIGQAEVERGTETVLEAISEVGISDWLTTVWQHDIGVYQHTLSVAGYAAAFGAEIGLGALDLRRLTKAALLHDIGKARIPLEILNKPGPLNPDEALLMHRHAAIGAELLVAQGGFEDAIIDVVRHHHEKLDGSGYPDGLAGGAVSDLVRMVTICDIYSALTERRAYREPLGSTEAVTIMSGLRGQLDRALFHAFAPVIAQGQAAPAWA